MPEFCVAAALRMLPAAMSAPAHGDTIVGAVFLGGHDVAAHNEEIGDFALSQFFCTAPNTDQVGARAFWCSTGWQWTISTMSASWAGGRLSFDPLREVADVVSSNCD